MRKFLGLPPIAILLFPLAVFAYVVTVNTTVNDPGNVVNSVGFASNDTALGAQSFTTVGAGTLTSITVRMSRDGTSGTLYYAVLKADSSGSPANGLGIATSTNSFALSTFPATVSFKCSLTTLSDDTYTFNSVALAASTKYWIVLTTNGVYDSTNSNRVCGDTSSAHSEVAQHTTTNLQTWSTVTTSAFYFTANITPSTPSATFSFFQWGWQW